MTTDLVHTRVSRFVPQRALLLATTTVVLAFSACGRAPGGTAIERPRPAAITIRFDNESRERVHVYLIGETREWWLGRVEPGAVATLRLPEASLTRNPAFARLTVLAGERLTLQAARIAHASVTTVAQPVSSILTQHWRFAQGQLIPAERETRRMVPR